MPASIDGLRFPAQRVILPRTRLAYIHVANLLNDAKRERASRVFGYVAIWLPEEVVLLYLQEGEVVTATRTVDGKQYQVLPIAEALAHVPPQPEFGWLSFNEAADEQLACMFQAQVQPATPWPAELVVEQPKKLFPYLMATTFDGVLEVVADDAANYLIFRDGVVKRAYLATDDSANPVDHVAALFARGSTRHPLRVRRWDIAPPLPVQAKPQLILAYRELVSGLVVRLVSEGADTAPAIAEAARKSLVDRHAVLEHFAVTGRAMKDPAADTATLTAGIASWLAELLWTTSASSDTPPERLLREMMFERRHLFQSAGLCDALPWRVQW
ncbi:MAG: hypothetical protein HY275_04010 [Gemmatimonadetes bacterium]|nr:hypothetical protein [Gemmatimonadota bacterium]